MSDSNAGDSNFSTGAVRSAAADALDFTSLPLIGLIGVARTANEGGTKYGRYNYMQGMPVHDLLNHAFLHITMFLLGDRSEPHLEHAAWGLLAAIQSYTLTPELSAKHLLGPGATITPAVQAFLDEQKPILAAKRKAGVFDKLGEWTLHGLKEIQTILGQRYKYAGIKPVLDDVPAPTPKPRKPYSVMLNKSIKRYVRKEAAKKARNVERNIRLSEMLREKDYLRRTDSITIPADVCKDALAEVRKMSGQPHIQEGDVIYGWPSVAPAGRAAELLRRKDKDAQGYHTTDFAPTRDEREDRLYGSRRGVIPGTKPVPPPPPCPRPGCQCRSVFATPPPSSPSRFNRYD